MGGDVLPLPRLGEMKSTRVAGRWPYGSWIVLECSLEALSPHEEDRRLLVSQRVITFSQQV